MRQGELKISKHLKKGSEKLKTSSSSIKNRLLATRTANNKNPSRGSINYANVTNIKTNSLRSSSHKGATPSSGTPPQGFFKKIFWYMRPSRLFKFLFSKQGLFFSLKALGIAIVLFGLFIFGLFAYYRKDLNKLKPEEIAARIQNSGVKYYDRTGQVLLWEQKGEKDRTVVDGDKISQNLKNATVALEDRNFYSHRGFDPKGMVRAFFSNSSSDGGQQGGSTITQQLVKNELLTRERSYSRKVKELILAIEVERTYSKDQILNLYLNSINYGGTATGIERATQRYFGDSKHASDLSIEESIFLASIPQRPSRFDPYNNSFNKDLLVGRMEVALNSMVETGYISKDDAAKIKPADILDKIQPKELALKGQYEQIKAPHFVLEVEKQLEEKLGNKELQTGGYKVITTLDWDLQQIADKAVADGMPAIDRSGGDNAALVSIDVDTGQTLAYVGSRDFNHPGYGQYNEATQPRQPGSSMKPFGYSQLMENPAWGPGSIIMDTPKSWPGRGGNGEPYNPKNWDGKYFGPMPIREALPTSRNLTALKAIDIAGVEPTIKLAQNMGDKALCEKTRASGQTPDIGVVLGGCEVKLEEHVLAYSTFAREGKYKPESKVLRIEKSNGEIIEEWKDTAGEQVLNPEIAWLMSDILSDDNARSKLFGRNSRDIVFNPSIKSAAKTGTTNRADNTSGEGWMMGFTPKIATGVVVGNHDFKGLKRGAITSRMTGPIYTDFMREAYKLKGWKSEDFFERPAGIQRLNVGGREDWFQSWFQKPKEIPGKEYLMDKVSKKVATNCTPQDAIEKVMARGVQTGDNQEDVQYQADGWDLENQDDIHNCSDVKPGVTITSSVLSPGSYKLAINISQGTHPLQAAELVIDGAIPQSLPPGISNTTVALTPGSHTIVVTVIDSALYKIGQTLTINVPQSP
jgi:membrane peptidoglycan carboxypeptidase